MQSLRSRSCFPEERISAFNIADPHLSGPQRFKVMISGAKTPEMICVIFYKSASFGSVRCYEMKPAKYPAKKTLVIRYATMVDTATLMSPGIMKEWLSRYFPITVVPERSKFTVAISEG